MRFKTLFPLFGFLAASALAAAQTSGGSDQSKNMSGAPTPSAPSALDPSYHLSVGDEIELSVFGEPSLSVASLIDRSGKVRLPLVGDVVVGGLTAREAEGFIEKTYIREEYLKAPQVTLKMRAYSVREVVVLGAVVSPGTFKLPQDTTSVDIRDLISRVGGFTPVARGDAVTITSRREDGSESTQTVDVARLMFGRGKEPSAPVLVYPGDRVFVPQRLF